MKFFRLFAAFVAVLLSVSVAAEPITFIHQGTGSGTLDGVPFAETSFTVIGTGNTGNMDGNLPFASWTPHNSATIDIEGVGSFEFLTQTYTMAEHLGQWGEPSVTFGREWPGGPVGLLWGPLNHVFGTWDTTTDLAPVTGDAFHVEWEPTETTGGTLIFDATDLFSVTATFEAFIGGAAIDIDPASLSSTLQQGQSESHSLIVSNQGEEALEWQMTEQADSAGRVLRAPRSSPVAVSTAIPDQTSGGLSGSKPDTGPGHGPAGVGDPGHRARHWFPARRGDQVVLTHSESMDILNGHSVACSPDEGATTSVNRFLRVFTLADFDVTSEFEVNEVTFGIETLDMETPVTVNLYSLDGPFLYENLTLLGSATENLSAQTLSTVSVPVTGTAPAGSTLVVEIDVPDLSGTGHFFPGSNDAGETGSTYLVAPTCDIPEPRPFANIGVPDLHLVMAVAGTGTVEPLDCTLPDWLTLDPVAGTVPAGESMDVEVIVDAQGLAAGDVAASLCFASNDSGAPLIAVPVVLTVEEAHEPGELTISPGLLDFGATMAGQTLGPLSATLDNTGGSPVEVTAVDEPDAPFVRTGGSCQAEGLVLDPGASCTLDYAFEPMEEGGFGATITIASDIEPVVLTLAGEAVAKPEPEPEVGLLMDVSFGEVLVDGLAEAEIQLANTGEGSLLVDSITPPLAPFGLTEGSSGSACEAAPFVLGPGESCTWVVWFQPSAEGEYDGWLGIVSNAASSPDGVFLEGVAVAGAPAPGPVAIPALSRPALILLLLSVLAIAGLFVTRARPV